MGTIKEMIKELSRLKYSYLVRYYEESDLCKKELHIRANSLMRRPNRIQVKERRRRYCDKYQGK